MKTIYNVYVPLKGKEQFQRLLKACESKNLKINPVFNLDWYFCSSETWNEFGAWISIKNKTKVTEKQFLKLLENETKK